LDGVDWWRGLRLIGWFARLRRLGLRRCGAGELGFKVRDGGLSLGALKGAGDSDPYRVGCGEKMKILMLAAR